MRFGLLIFLILIAGAVVQTLFPWWSLVVVAFLGGLLFPLKTGGQSFLAGFLAGFLLWGGYAFYLGMLNEGLLAERVGMLLGGVPAVLLPWISGIFAGIFTGLGALTGRLGRSVYQPTSE